MRNGIGAGVVAGIVLAGSAGWAEAKDARPRAPMPPQIAPEAEPAETPPKKEPAHAPLTVVPGQPFCFLRDGTRVAGTIDVKTFTLQTPYGPLSVPASEVVRIRFGKKSDPELRDKVAKLIGDLGASDLSVREKATGALLSMGARVIPELTAALQNEDAEVKSRAEELLNQIQEMQGDEEEWLGEDDELTTKKFVAAGTLDIQTVTLHTPYGTLNVPKKEILQLQLNPADQMVKTVKVQAANWTNAPLDTKIQVKPGDRIEMRATGSLAANNVGAGNIPPEGFPNFGNAVPGIAMGALCFRIGNSGNWAVAGGKYEGIADRAGKLTLATAIHQGWIQNVSGAFTVEIRIRPR